MFAAHRFFLYIVAALHLAIAPEHRRVVFQFAALGAIFVAPSTIAEKFVVLLATPLERKIKSSARFRQRQRSVSGLGMIGLGAYGALADSK
jgi:threonine/homoserine/homoserine lactone efflux protein